MEHSSLLLACILVSLLRDTLPGSTHELFEEITLWLSLWDLSIPKRNEFHDLFAFELQSRAISLKRFGNHEERCCCSRSGLNSDYFNVNGAVYQPAV